ncbi:hypothetical protein HQQ80_00380 [Microbacteriaceae bacterium VKM Ac-2855]|nr:hypothetical protein [Microbacteriaceae bacterium VKM Ac-2855]
MFLSRAAEVAERTPAITPDETCMSCGHAEVGETFDGTTTCMFEISDYGFGDAEYCECHESAHVGT